MNKNENKQKIEAGDGPFKKCEKNYPIDAEAEGLEREVEVGVVANHGSAHVVVGVLDALLVPGTTN